MSDIELFTRLAELYESFYVPALLDEWAQLTAEAAAVRPGHRVLDVACGTGILARTVAERVGPGGAVIGLDRNEGMLAIARRKAPALEWHQGGAEELPFDDDSFDVAASQFGLMFFSDRPRAIQEMMRVLRPGGRLAVTVWDSAENFPIYGELAGLLQRRYGDEVVDEFLTPHSLGSPELLTSLFAEAGVAGADVARRNGTARFPSLRDWLWIEVKEWLLGDRLDDTEFEALFAEARERFRPFVTDEGLLVSAAPGYVVTSTKP